VLVGATLSLLNNPAPIKPPKSDPDKWFPSSPHLIVLGNNGIMTCYAVLNDTAPRDQIDFMKDPSQTLSQVIKFTALINLLHDCSLILFLLVGWLVGCNRVHKLHNFNWRMALRSQIRPPQLHPIPQLPWDLQSNLHNFLQS
jgi:hypothetical protein